MVPTCPFPPRIPFTLQVTAALENGDTMTVNWRVCRVAMEAAVGAIETVMVGVGAVTLIIAVAETEGLATLTARSVTTVAVAGAV